MSPLKNMQETISETGFHFLVNYTCLGESVQKNVYIFFK